MGLFRLENRGGSWNRSLRWIPLDAGLSLFGSIQVGAGGVIFLEMETGSKIGSIDVRPYEQGFIGDLGLWIGKPYHGRGYGSLAVTELLRYSFGSLEMEKVEAKVFVGNQASRRMFEKLGFTHEGTIRSCVRKHGRLIDEWLFGILGSEFLNQQAQVQERN